MMAQRNEIGKVVKERSAGDDRFYDEELKGRIE
jgi:hypothetical protein